MWTVGALQIHFILMRHFLSVHALVYQGLKTISIVFPYLKTQLQKKILNMIKNEYQVYVAVETLKSSSSRILLQVNRDETSLKDHASIGCCVLVR